MLVSKICLTGGPCAGKTTALNLIKDKLMDEGYNVIMINEKATELLHENNLDPRNYEKFNGEIVRREIKHEYKSELIARNSADKYVIITDRGLMDNVGYAGRDAMGFIFAKYELDFDKANDNYDMVIHMTTAAKDNPKEYNLESNEVRYETIEEAKYRDEMLLKAWSDHKNRVIISCKNEDFSEKLDRTIDTVVNHVKNNKIKNKSSMKMLYKAYQKLDD